MNMDFNELRCFVAVAEELNFRKAAERLNLTQPPLTRTIMKLEQRLGIKLLTRTTRKVTLTSAGAELLRAARPLLEHADGVACAIRHHIAPRRDRFVVGCNANAFFSVLPPLLDELRGCYPSVDLQVEELQNDVILSRLASATIDVGIVLWPALSHPELHIRPVVQSRMSIAVAMNHHHAGSERPVPLRAFSRDTFIMHARDEMPTLYDEILRSCAEAGFQPRVINKTREHNCLGLVSAGVGVHLVGLSHKTFQSSTVKILDLAGDAPTYGIAIAYRKNDPCELLSVFKEWQLLPTVERTLF